MTKRLKSLSIEHFRGFYEEQTINFAIPNGDPGSGLTVIVGPNNTGKSTIFEAIRRFYIFRNMGYENSDRHFGEKLHFKMVCIDEETSTQEIKELFVDGSRPPEVINENNYPTITDFFFITPWKYWSHGITNSEDTRKHYKNHLMQHSSRAGGDGSIGSSISRIYRDKSKKNEFDLILQKILYNFSNWEVEIADGGKHYVSYNTGSESEHHSGMLGDGVVGVFKIALALCECDDSEVLILDEPEVSLHPQAQKRLAELFAEKSKDRQIIVITHSPYFVRWNDIGNGAKILKLSKPEDKKCIVSELKDETITCLKRLTNNWQTPHLLDHVAKEVFFTEKKILFVEGQEDMGLITKFIKDEKIDINYEIFGYGSGGSGNIKTFLHMADDLGIKAGAIFDGNEEAKKDECAIEFPDFYIMSIDTDDIREKNAKKHPLIKKIIKEINKNKSIPEDSKEKIINIINEIKTDGMFSERGEIKAEHKSVLKGIINHF